MTSTEDLTSQLYSVLTDVSHPIEGTFYLFLIAVVFRWLCPETWNKLLNKISAEAEKTINKDEDS